MIFSELYSAYYNTIAAMISRIVEGEDSEKELQKIAASLMRYGYSLSQIKQAFKKMEN